MNSLQKWIYKTYIKEIEISDDVAEINRRPKVSIFGCNNVSVQIVSHLICRYFPSEIFVFDESEQKLDSYIADFKFFKCINCSLLLKCCTDIEETANSDICIICFHNFKNNTDCSADSVIDNVYEYKKYIPIIVKNSPNTIFVVYTFPCGIMTYYCWKYSNLPENRIIGIGPTIASFCFRKVLSNHFQIAPSQVYCWTAGRLNYNSKTNQIMVKQMPLWSTVIISGIRLSYVIDFTFASNYQMMDRIMWENDQLELTENYRRSLYDIGPACYNICSAILTNSKKTYSISCNLKGLYGLTHNCFLGMPCLIGRYGYTSHVKIHLLQNEVKEIRKAAQNWYDIISKIDKKMEEIENETLKTEQIKNKT